MSIWNHTPAKPVLCLYWGEAESDPEGGKRAQREPAFPLPAAVCPPRRNARNHPVSPHINHLHSLRLRLPGAAPARGGACPDSRSAQSRIRSEFLISWRRRRNLGEYYTCRLVPAPAHPQTKRHWARSDGPRANITNRHWGLQQRLSSGYNQTTNTWERHLCYKKVYQHLMPLQAIPLL